MMRDPARREEGDTRVSLEVSALRENAIRDAILTLCHQRGAGKTICPSEAARLVAGKDDDWRALMEDVRSATAKLQDAGEIAVTQKGAIVDVRKARGAIRLGLT